MDFEDELLIYFLQGKGHLHLPRQWAESELFPGPKNRVINLPQLLKPYVLPS